MSATTFSRLRPALGSSSSGAAGNGASQLPDSPLVMSASTLNGGSVGSSESSDPLESDYSEEDVEPDDDDDEEDDCENHEDNDVPEAGNDRDDDNEDDDDDDKNAQENVERHYDEQREIVPANDHHAINQQITNEDEEVDDGNETDEDGRDCLDTTKGQKPFFLDDFQIIKTVGTGTFGRVCLCKDKKNDKFCAMKILAMTDVIRLKQVEHVKNEKSILQEISHPFVVNLLWSTKDDCCLYMLFEYVCGGELFSYLRNAGRISSSAANFYASEIVLALEYLHSLSIVYRDLKPENLLINRDGHLKITDFGFAKKLRDRTWTLCGTPEYLAPEIIQSKGHNRAVDWWALGILIYEMLVGYPPFYDDNPFGIYEKILSGKIDWPRQMDPIAKDLVKKLLVLDRTKRLGNMKNGVDDVKRHRWFKHLNWDDVLNKKSEPPILPKISSEGDTSNFDEYPETDWKPARALDQSDMQLFKDF